MLPQQINMTLLAFRDSYATRGKAWDFRAGEEGNEGDDGVEARGRGLHSTYQLIPKRRGLACHTLPPELPG